MQRCCIYKLKDENSLKNDMDSYFSSYVYLDDFISNPLDEDTKKLYCLYTYINIDTLERISQLTGSSFLPTDDFEKYFEEFMTQIEINEKLRTLEVES